MKKKKFNRKIWMGVGVLGLGLILWLVFLGPNEQTGSDGPGQTPTPVAGPDQPAITTITSDQPSQITAVRFEAFDLGPTPTSLEVDQPGTWNIIAHSENPAKQQEVVKELGPGQGQAIHFGLTDSHAWTTPAIERDGSIIQPLLTDNALLGINPDNNHLQRLLPDGSRVDLVAEPIRVVIWRDQQNYLYLTANDVLVLASPSGGWRIEGVWVLSGNESQTAWLSSDGRIWLFDWTGSPTATGIDAPEAIGIFLGSRNLYVFEWGEFLEVNGMPLHPAGWIEVYDLDGYGSQGRVAVLTYPETLSEVGDYSFWQINEGVEIIDNPNANADYSWGFSRLVTDLIAGVDYQGQPVVYLLTDAGEVWDFKPQRETYNLVGLAPEDGQSGSAIPGSLIQADGAIYFGFSWEIPDRVELTYRVELTGS